VRSDDSSEVVIGIDARVDVPGGTIRRAIFRGAASAGIPENVRRGKLEELSEFLEEFSRAEQPHREPLWRRSPGVGEGQKSDN
jgi:hypothetical protein